MSDEKVIQLMQAMTMVPKRASGICRHTSIIVDQDRRLLECKTCGRMIEPFDYLYGYATKQQNIVWGLNNAQSELKRLKLEIDELKRQKRNLNSRVSRAKKRVG